MAVVFFSFTEANRHTVAKIKGRAMNGKYPNLDFKVRDLLKRWDTEDDVVIRQAITKSIKGTSKTIVFVGKYTYKSKWVKEEVKMTLKRKKPVYAIWNRPISFQIFNYNGLNPLSLKTFCID